MKMFKASTIVTVLIVLLIGNLKAQNISLVTPLDSSLFHKNKAQNFQWGAPDNLVGTVEYVLTIKEINNGQTPLDAMTNNTDWYSFTSPFSSGAYSNIFTSPVFDYETWYVWKVQAYDSAGSLTAESELRVLRGKLFVDEFWINSTIIVMETTNTSLTSFEGWGWIPVNAAGDLEYVFMDNLTIKSNSGYFSLIGGYVTAPLPISERIRTFSFPSGEYRFISDSIRYSIAGGTRVHGHFEWDLPVVSDTAITITSDDAWYLYNSFNVTASKILSPNVIMDNLKGLPSDYELSLASVSFRLLTNTFTCDYSGSIEDAKGKFNFSHDQNDSLTYFDVTGNYATDQYGISTGISSITGVADFSDNESFGSLPNDWKGIWFDTDTPTLSYTGSIFSLDNFAIARGDSNFIDSTGLNYHLKADETIQIKYEGYPAQVDSFHMDIEGSTFASSTIIGGGIDVPYIADDSSFTFQVTFDGMAEDSVFNMPVDFTFDAYGAKLRSFDVTSGNQIISGFIHPVTKEILLLPDTIADSTLLISNFEMSGVYIYRFNSPFIRNVTKSTFQTDVPIVLNVYSSDSTLTSEYRVYWESFVDHTGIPTFKTGEGDIKIYPTIADQWINIEPESGSKMSQIQPNIQIVNASGQLMKRTSTSRISVSELSNGMYYAIVKYGEYAIAQRFVVKHL